MNMKEACMKGDMNRVAQLIRDGYDMLAAIRLARRYGHIDIVTLLSNEGVDLSANDNEAIIAACWDGYPEDVILLLNDERVDPSVKNNIAIRVASYHGHTEIVTLLLNDSRVDPSDKNNDALLMSDNDDIIRLLIADYRFRDLEKTGVNYRNNDKGEKNLRLAKKLYKAKRAMAHKALELCLPVSLPYDFIDL